VYIETPYVRWLLAPYELKKVQVPAKTLQGFRTHKLVLKVYDAQKNTINASELTKSFAAVYIHGADAYIMHRYLEKSIQLKRELNNLDVELSWYHNHDCFGYNVNLSVFLEYIVRDCYLDLYKLNYLEMLDKNLDTEKVKKYIKTVEQKPLDTDGNPNKNYLSLKISVMKTLYVEI
jgi:hypothetical protein